MNYGLLGEINRPKSVDDSEDSETEDYKDVEERLDTNFAIYCFLNRARVFEHVSSLVES